LDYGGSKVYRVSDSSRASPSPNLLEVTKKEDCNKEAEVLQYRVLAALADIKCGLAGHAGHFDPLFSKITLHNTISRYVFRR
jgi:hypothetical protein